MGESESKWPKFKFPTEVGIDGDTKFYEVNPPKDGDISSQFMDFGGCAYFCVSEPLDVNSSTSFNLQEIFSASVTDLHQPVSHILMTSQPAGKTLSQLRLVHLFLGHKRLEC